MNIRNYKELLIKDEEVIYDDYKGTNIINSFLLATNKRIMSYNTKSLCSIDYNKVDSIELKSEKQPLHIYLFVIILLTSFFFNNIYINADYTISILVGLNIFFLLTMLFNILIFFKNKNYYIFVYTSNHKLKYRFNKIYLNKLKEFHNYVLTRVFDSKEVALNNIISIKDEVENILSVNKGIMMHTYKTYELIDNNLIYIKKT